MANGTDNDNRADFAWHVHSYMNEYIRFADTKAGLVIAWSSALLGVLVGANFHKLFISELMQWKWGWVGAIDCAGFVFLIVAFVCAFMVIFPRLPTSQPTGFIFWKSIRAYGDRQKFIDAFNAQTPSLLTSHVAQHLYDISGVCNRKYGWINASIFFAFIGSLICGVMYLCG